MTLSPRACAPIHIFTGSGFRILQVATITLGIGVSTFEFGHTLTETLYIMPILDEAMDSLPVRNSSKGRSLFRFG